MSTAAGTGGAATSGVGEQTLLYDQTDNAGGNGAPDQDFEAAYDIYDCEGADDFDVTWVDGWLVQRVDTIGTSGGTSSSVDVVFYGDSAGFPGAQLCSYSGIAATDVSGSLSITLPSGCTVPQGRAWVAIQVNQDYATNGQHFWSNRSVASFSESVWRNPGGGFAVPACLDWGRQATTCGVGGGTNPDFLFQIWGENAQPGPTATPPPAVNAEPVPSLNTYGIIAMVVLLVGVAVLVMWRRS
ncbi:MAG TPA: hypothetical protein VLT32_10190 [Candidatus Sulfomarinibacteraceae bacterium]|nr:hypothetical protein [Candidatus Sulfomarinibacteraceae bacterium]